MPTKLPLWNILLIFLVFEITFQKEVPAAQAPQQQVQFNDNANSQQIHIEFKQPTLKQIPQIANPDYSVVKEQIYPPENDKFKPNAEKDAFVKIAKEKNGNAESDQTKKKNENKKQAKKEVDEDTLKKIDPKPKQTEKETAQKQKKQKTTPKSPSNPVPQLEAPKTEQTPKSTQNQQPQKETPNQPATPAPAPIPKLEDPNTQIPNKVHQMNTPSQVITYDFEAPVNPNPSIQQKSDHTPSSTPTDSVKPQNNPNDQPHQPQPQDQQEDQQQQQPQQRVFGPLPLSHEDLAYMSDNLRRRVEQPINENEVQEEYMHRQLGIGAMALLFVAIACCLGENDAERRRRYQPTTSLQDQKN